MHSYKQVDSSNVVTLYETLQEIFRTEAKKRCEVTTYKTDVQRKEIKFSIQRVKTGHIELQERRSFIVDNY